MICDNCKIERLVTDFIKNQKYCYRCEYQIKLSKTPKKRTKKQKLCRVCQKEITQTENVKKRQRDVFCSHQCAQKGHEEQLKNHWTRLVGSCSHYHYFRPEKGTK